MINLILGLVGLLGGGALYVLFLRLKNALLAIDVDKTNTQENTVDTKITSQQQSIDQLANQVQGDIKAYEDAKNNPGSDSTH